MQLITLTSDFGMKDHRLASLKARLIGAIPSDVRFVDISHEVSAYNLVEAAFLFESAWNHFPRGTIHLLWIYPQESNEIVIARCQGHIMIAPDNGLLSLIDGAGQMEYYKSKTSAHEYPHEFAFIAELIRQCIVPNTEMPAFERISQIKQRIALQPVYSRNEIRASYLYADRFGNVYFNLKQSIFEKIRNGNRFQVFFKGMEPLTSISKSYGDVSPGEILCKFNEAGFFQISQYLGSAVEALELKEEDSIQILFYD
jgi:S-adenosylmethionine hydrolase